MTNDPTERAAGPASNPSPGEHADIVVDIVRRLDGLHLLAAEAVLNHVRSLIAATVRVDATSPRAQGMADDFRRGMRDGAAHGYPPPGGRPLH